MPMPECTPGEIAYAAYAALPGARRGEPWDELPFWEQQRWEAAARAVLAAAAGRMTLLWVVVAWRPDAQLPQIQLCGAYRDHADAEAHIRHAQPRQETLTFDIRLCPFPEKETPDA